MSNVQLGEGEVHIAVDLLNVAGDNDREVVPMPCRGRGLMVM